MLIDPQLDPELWARRAVSGDHYRWLDADREPRELAAAERRLERLVGPGAQARGWTYLGTVGRRRRHRVPGQSEHEWAHRFEYLGARAWVAASLAWAATIPPPRLDASTRRG